MKSLARRIKGALGAAAAGAYLFHHFRGRKSGSQKIGRRYLWGAWAASSPSLVSQGVNPGKFGRRHKYRLGSGLPL